MADLTQVDVEQVERLSMGLRTAALEMAETTGRFAAQCGGIGEAYGALPQAHEVARQYLAVVGVVSDHLTSRTTEQQSHADVLAASCGRYRTTQTDASAAIAGVAADAGSGG